MNAGAGLLLDDVRHPPLRVVVGRLLARARSADFAIARIRLAAIELKEAEIRSVERCRVLLGRMDVDSLAGPGGSGPPLDPSRGAAILTLRSFLESGRVLIRTTGTPLWAPDFSVLSGLPANGGVHDGAVCLVGAHYFARPYPTRGPALTCLLSGSSSVASARRRFDELWELGYDVLPVVTEMVDASIAGSGAAPPDGLAS